MLKGQVGSLLGVVGYYWMHIHVHGCSRMFTDVHGCSRILNVVKFWLRTLLVTICRFSGLRSQMIAYVSYIGWSGKQMVFFSKVFGFGHPCHPKFGESRGLMTIPLTWGFPYSWGYPKLAGGFLLGKIPVKLG